MESFNGKLRDELLDREIFYTLQEVQVLTEQYRQTYNHLSPHVPGAGDPALDRVSEVEPPLLPGPVLVPFVGGATHVRSPPYQSIPLGSRVEVPVIGL